MVGGVWGGMGKWGVEYGEIWDNRGGMGGRIRSYEGAMGGYVSIYF